MNVLHLGFTDKTTDSRTRDLLKISGRLGNVYFIGLSEENYKEENNIYVSKKGSKVFTFIRYAFTVFKFAWSHDVECLFIDNYHASFCGLVIKKIKNPKYVIHDVRELYLYRSLPSLFGKMLLFCEKTLMREADVVICANHTRALISKGLFKLKNTPLVFENIHWFRTCSESIGGRNDGTIKVVVTDGLSPERMTDEFIMSIARLDARFQFYFLGKCSESEKHHLEEMIDIQTKNRIHLLGQMDCKELGEFLSNCDIGIVKYNFDDLNNIFCASGKIYEFIMSGLPVVTTEHQVFTKMCQEHGIGEADNSFSRGLIHVANNLNKYKENVIRYQNDILKHDYISECVLLIKKRLIIK